MTGYPPILLMPFFILSSQFVLPNRQMRPSSEPNYILWARGTFSPLAVSTMVLLMKLSQVASS